jgi:hypothetical protein
MRLSKLICDSKISKANFPANFHLYVATIEQHLHLENIYLRKKLLNQGFLLVKLKSSLRKFYGRHHDLVDRYGIFVLQMTMDSGVRVIRSLVLCACFVDRCLSFCTFSFGHCVVCSSSMYGFWLPLWYLLVIVLYVPLRCTDSDYPFGIFWSLCCLFLFDVRILITPLVSFGHCVVCSSSMYGFWLPLWYLLAIVLSVLLRCTDSDYPFGIFWPLMAKRYQRGNQNPYIEEEQTTQWPKDTKGVIRIRTSKKNRQHKDQKIPKG